MLATRVLLLPLDLPVGHMSAISLTMISVSKVYTVCNALSPSGTPTLQEVRVRVTNVHGSPHYVQDMYAA